LKRWAKRLGLGALVLLAGLLALLVGAWLFLTSPAGERLVQRRLVSGLSDALPGNLSVGSLGLSGTRLVLEDLVLRDPEGEVVLRVGRLQAHVALLPLLRQELDLREVLLERVTLDLVHDERGLNLLRAVRQAGQEQAAEGGPLDWTVHLRELSLQQGEVRYRQEVSDALAPAYEVEGLALEGSATYRGPRAHLEGELALAGDFTRPTAGPLKLSATFDHAPARTAAKLGLTLLDAVAQAQLTGNAQQDSLGARVETLSLPHGSMRALFPGWPLIADVQAEGLVGRDGNFLDADLALRAAEATAELKGRLDVARLRAHGVRIEARGVDLSRLVEGAPASDLALTARAEVAGTSLETLVGEVTLSMPRSQLEGQAFGPVSLRARADQGQFALSELDLQVPGARLTGGGKGTLERLRFDGRLVASDLALLGRTLGRVARPGGLPIAGRGALDVTVQGPLQHPGVAAKGRFDTLRWEDLRASALELDGTIADVRRPLDADARLRIGTLQVGERRFHQVRGDVATRGRELSAEVTARGFADVGLQLRGVLDEDREGLRLSELAVRYPEASWTLENPTHLRFGGGDLQLDELWLRSGRQRLGLGGTLRGTSVDARLVTENLELAQLPRAALPADLVVAGELSLRATARGRLGRPTVAAQVQLRNARWNDFRDLGLELDARYADNQAEGRLRVLAFASQLEGTFTLPIQGLTSGAKAPLRGDLAILPTRLEALFAELGVDPGLTGNAAATIQVTGTAADPRVRIVVDGDNVQQRAGPPGDLDVIVESAADGKLIARIDLSTMGSHSHLLLRTPWEAGQFLTGPVTGRMFLETPVQLEASFRDVPLAAAHAWGLWSKRLDGTFSLSLQAEGPVLDPRGLAYLTVHGAAGEGLAPVDASATLQATSDRVGLTLGVLRGATRLANLESSLSTSLGALFKGADPAKVAMAVKGQLGPVRLSELEAVVGGSSPEDPEAEGPRPDGVVTAQVNLRGTFDDPKAEVAAQVEKLGVGQLALGRVDLDARYGSGKAHTQVQLTSARGGRMSLDASARVALSASALGQGIAWRQVPVDAQLSAVDFDPSFLSGVSARLREVAGRIDADARVQGPAGAPDFRGSLSWQNGRLGLLGYGQFRDIQVRLTGSNQSLVLENLSAQSGSGRVRLSLRADRKGELFLLSGDGELHRFPLIVDDQLVAIVSGRLGVSGDATREHIYVRNLAIPELHLELPEVRRKDLQGLDRPGDVVRVRRGAPLYKRRDAQIAAGGAAGAGAEGNGSEYGGLRLTVLVNAPRNIWVRGSDVNAELGLSEDFRVEVAERVLVYGEVRFLRGRVDVLGRRFDVLRDSQVRFAGPPSAPYINVTAEHGNEREQVAVFTTIRGQGREITIRVSAKPALSESEIYTLLATGRRTLKRGSGASMTGAEAASVVGSYAASQLKRMFASKLPIDVLSIEAGQQGLADASLEAGAYVSDKIYLGSVYRLGARPERNENAAGFRLEYQITPRWNLETEYGTARVGGADIMWSREY
jgi:translocation and assembly module TamB